MFHAWANMGHNNLTLAIASFTFTQKNPPEEKKNKTIFWLPFCESSLTL